MTDFLDYIVRYVPNYGFLPIVSVDGVEKYRGEFKKTAQEAFTAALLVWEEKIK